MRARLFVHFPALLLVLVLALASAALFPLAAAENDDEEDEIDNPTVLTFLSGLPEPREVFLPWHPGRFTLFQTGSDEENHATARSGKLTGRLYRAPQNEPAPYVVLLSGCGSTYQGANGLWFKLWARTLQDMGVGALTLNSFGPRGVHEVCGEISKLWAQRRVDDAYSALAWLARQPFADPRRIFVMGMSNGARTALLAVSAAESWRFRHFAAAVALYAPCDQMPPHDLLAPALLLNGAADDVAAPSVCDTYIRQRRDTKMRPRLVTYPDAFHLFDVFPRDDNYSAPEVLDARRQVETFLRQAGGFGEAAAQRTATPAPASAP